MRAKIEVIDGGIGNDTPWSGKFVGISGMRLTRGSEVMELERRPGNESC